MGSQEDIISFWERYSHRSIFGIGKIICQHGKEQQCNIHLWQLKNGRMVVAINTNSTLKCSSNNYHFTGKLQENASTLVDWPFDITGIQLSVDFFSLDSTGYDILGFVDGTVCIYDTNRVKPHCQKIVAELTNLSLNSLPIQFDMDEYRIELIHNEGTDYQIARSLRISAILGKLIISSQKPLSDEDWEGVIDQLCHLLSLCQRSYVAKVSKFGFNAVDGLKDHYKLYGLKGIEATKASRLFLISSTNVPSYLKVSFPKLPQVYKLWNLGTALDHYLQAIDRESAWAMGAGLVVALECLVSAYCKGGTNREYHFGEMEEFIPFSSGLANNVMDQLKLHFPETTNRLNSDIGELSSWQSSFMNLNRRSFGRKIRNMLDELGIVKPNSDVLRRYVDLRNDLVHNGYPDSSKDFANDLKYIMQMADFLENIFLVILGYQDDVKSWDNYLVWE